jgi:hypothetical protein
MKRLLTFALLPLLALAVHHASAADADAKAAQEAKEALQTLNDFVGTWDGDGKLKAKTWAESLEWGWNFKSPEPRMVLKFKDSKAFKTAEVRYVAEKKEFEATVVDLKDQKKVFTGKLNKDTLLLERTDAESKAAERLKLNAIDNGARISANLSHKAEGKTAYVPDFDVSYSNKAVSFAPGQKKPECIVSGGIGNGTVTHNGKTYYICCSGCRDAFNANPDKFVKEWEAKGKK